MSEFGGWDGGDHTDHGWEWDGGHDPADPGHAPPEEHLTDPYAVHDDAPTEAPELHDEPSDPEHSSYHPDDPGDHGTDPGHGPGDPGGPDDPIDWSGPAAADFPPALELDLTPADGLPWVDPDLLGAEPVPDPAPVDPPHALLADLTAAGGTDPAGSDEPAIRALAALWAR